MPLLPIHKASLLRERRLHLGYEFGTDPESSWAAQFERNKRGIQAPSEKARTIYYPNQNRPSPDGGTAPPLAPPVITITDRRFHKEGSTYVTVSPQHLSADDPVLDPAQKHTLADGYTEAVRLVGLLTANGFTSINDRVVVVVFGGVYEESVTVSNSRIDFQGIGRPKIHGIFTVGASCRKILVEGFEFYNDPPDPRFPYLEAAVVIESGAMSATLNSVSTIQFKDCWIHAPLTALYIKAWSHFENCRILGDENEGTGYHAAVVLFDDPLSWPRWCIFSGGLLSGQNTVGTPLHKGPALGIFAVDIDTLSVWIDNDDTARSGVLIKNAEVDGWTENYGWNMEYHACKIIEGQFINNLGAGSVHHIMHTHSNSEAAAVQASTWFTGGTEADVNYLVNFDDDNDGEPEVGYANVYIRNVIHAAPTNAGGSVVQPLGGNPQARVFGVHSATTKAFFYEIPGPAEGALLTSCDTSIAIGTPGQNTQGYLNY